MKNIFYLIFFLISNSSFAQGTIASCNDSTYGMSWNYNSLQEAKTAALKYCKDGGKIIADADFSGSCAAIASDLSNGADGWASRHQNESSASEAAISTCKKYGGLSCEVILKGCDTLAQNSDQTNYQQLNGASQCDSYGFQKGTNAYAQCMMQMDQLIRQQNYEQQRRANIEFQCRMQKAQAAFDSGDPFFNLGKQLSKIDQVYNNCMAGLPPPRSGKIDCTISGNNVSCIER
jgi:hypothetical protein